MTAVRSAPGGEDIWSRSCAEGSGTNQSQGPTTVNKPSAMTIYSETSARRFAFSRIQASRQYDSDGREMTSTSRSTTTGAKDSAAFIRAAPADRSARRANRR